MHEERENKFGEAKEIASLYHGIFSALLNYFSLIFMSGLTMRLESFLKFLRSYQFRYISLVHTLFLPIQKIQDFRISVFQQKLYIYKETDSRNAHSQNGALRYRISLLFFKIRTVPSIIYSKTV